MPTSKKAEEASETMNLDSHVVGRWIFLAGLVLAIIFGIIPDTLFASWFPTNVALVYQVAVYALLALGFIGGLLFIPEKREQHFIVLTLGVYILYQTSAAYLYQNLNIFPTFFEYLVRTFSSVAGLFMAPAVLAIFVRNAVSWFFDSED